MNILGISCYYHDSAAALVRDGMLVAAAHEERFTRKKHDSDFPAHAVDYCLREGNLAIGDIDYISFYDKPLLKFERILQTYLDTWPKSYPSFIKAMPVWIKEKMWIPQTIRKVLNYEGPVLFAEHHYSHAASAFLVSPYRKAAILTLDGVGEWDTTTYGIGEDSSITLLKSISFPHSLGLFYSAFTYYLGFRVNSAEYKVMGLAPYGEPRYFDLIRQHLIEIRDDGSFHMNMEYFIYDWALRMTGRKFSALFGQPAREGESPLLQFHKDVAASLQKVTDEIVVKAAHHLHHETGLTQLCMAGGVALNCVANSKVLAATPFKDIFIQPAAGDAGGAVGAAYYLYNTVLGNKRNYAWQHAFLGPAFSGNEIGQFLTRHEIPYEEKGGNALFDAIARLIADQKVIGWFQGRMEYGPRALGSRSILADARNPENWQRVNLKIKFRESFRPFAPTVMADRMGEYFDFPGPSPYMLFTAQVHESRRKEIPAVTHVDGSARLQTISRDEHPRYYDLIGKFADITGCPVIINTSFNVRGEPIVCSPEDAFRCFVNTDMDILVLGDYIIRKDRINLDSFRSKYATAYSLD